MAFQRQKKPSLGPGFARGEPRFVAEVELMVRRIVAFRGYGIPFAERPDVEQEIMTQLWQAVKRPGFDAGARFAGFVEIVASRRCVDWYRRRREPLELDQEPPDRRADAARRAVVGERRRLARAALAALAPECQQLIAGRFVEEKSYRRLARELGASEATLRVRLHRCLERARSHLADGNVVRFTARRSR